MKAAQIDAYGDVSAIEVRDIETPVITDDQVLVKVAASSLNPFDTTVRSGGAHEMAQMQFPATLGIDFAGTIVEIGSNVTGFTIGDSVYGQSNALFGASGALAEYASVNTGVIALAPKNISPIEAASLALAGESALQAIVDNMQLQSGQKLFINGGSGGVGAAAIQIAKHLGAHVAVSASADNRKFALSLGADEFIDYKTQNYKDSVTDYDAVLTNVFSDQTSELLNVLKKGGVAVSLVGGLDDDQAANFGVRAVNMFTAVTSASLDQLTKLIDDGNLRPTIDQTFTLDTIKDAYTARETQSIKGKIAILVQ